MRRTTTIRILRGVLLTVFLTVLIGLGALWQFGRAGQPVAAETLTDLVEDDVPAADDDLLASGVGFSQRVVQGDRELFLIRGCNDRADKDDNVFLDGCVEIKVSRPEGTYDLKSDEATFSRTTREARLEGNVLVTGPSGLTMETEWLELKEGGNLLVASQGSTFRSDRGLRGNAQNFRFNIERELLVLGGGARVTGTEEVEDETGQSTVERYVLAARRIVYDRRGPTVRAEGDVSLQQGLSRIESMRMQMWLDPMTERVRRMRALWRLRGTLREVEEIAAEAVEGAADGPEAAEEAPSQRPVQVTRILEFTGHSLKLFNDPILDQPERFELRGLPAAPTVLVARTPDEKATRSTSATYIDGTFLGGKLAEVTAGGRVHLVEVKRVDDKPQRREVIAERSFAEIDSQGELVRLRLEEKVYLEDGVLQARADKALLDAAQDRTDLEGTPVELRSQQGILNAPQVKVNGKTDLMTALGGVRTVLEESDAGAFASSPLGSGEGPIRVQSQEALVPLDGSEFLFKGQVRAWRGRNLLLADQLRGKDAEQSMVASGAPLETVWYPEPGEGEELEGPVEISAKVLTYDGVAGRMSYEEGVTAEQPGRSMVCDEMEVRLAESGEADEMDCQGAMTLRDQTLQRVITGDRALYHVAAGEVEVFGDPFTLDDRVEQTKLQGPSLWYRFEDGAYGRERPGAGS
ncbi:MAG: hypothetical protein AAF690_10585 [Acidobacteriota bacterium]